MSANQAWRAPRGDGAVLADPPLSAVGPQIARNRAVLDSASCTILGRPLVEVRTLARREAIATAEDYLRQAGEPVPEIHGNSLLLAGHQPDLFHPGVWVKNFALQGLARTHGCTPLNLVVDNDTAKSTTLRVPVQTGAGKNECAPSVGLIAEPFDHWAGEEPYEERRVHDGALFASFADRAVPLLKSWNYEPVLPEFWKEVRLQCERTPLLGERLARARRALERHWGCHNLEVPLSALCRTEAFAWSACHILANLPAFHETYNATVRDYRRRFGIKSRNHPVPDLIHEGDWWEVPFWGWRKGQTRRGRPLLRFSGQQLELRVGAEVWTTLPSDASAAVDAWRSLESHGLKLRSRALTTTLFARLFLGDLFIHGIGGAKYDALTDEIIRRFYGIEPPAFLMLSATLHLPLPVCPARPEQRAGLARMLRDLEYNPQRHLTPETTARAEVACRLREKQDWIDREPINALGKLERFQAIRKLSAELRPFVTDRMQRAALKLECCDRQLVANAVLQRRDYAFCLFPEEKLRPFCEQFLFLASGGR